jgi:hypothetical protein
MALRILVALSLVVYAETLAGASAPIENSDCLACHNDRSLISMVQGRSVRLYVGDQTFQNSVHGILGCTDCHTDIKSIPHASVLMKPACGSCHSGEQAAYAESTHGNDFLTMSAPTPE